jgi:hypothetical protein
MTANLFRLGLCAMKWQLVRAPLHLGMNLVFFLGHGVSNGLVQTLMTQMVGRMRQCGG